MRVLFAWAVACLAVVPAPARSDQAAVPGPADDGPGGSRTGNSAPAAPTAPPGTAPSGPPSVAPPPTAAAPEEPGDDREPGQHREPPVEKSRGKKAKVLDLQVKGRVLVDYVMDERQGWERTLGLGSARIALEGKIHGIQTVLEAELASRTLIRDAYVRLDGPFATRLYAGRFKAPFSVRENESIWRLPLVARGLVNDFVVERNALGGRQVGAMAAARPFAGRVVMEVAAFTAPPATAEERTREDFSAAVLLRPWRWLEVGATGYQANAAGDERQAGTAHVDLDLGPLGANVEAMAGRLREGPFTAAAALAWYEHRLGRFWRAGPVVGAEGLRLRAAETAVGWAATAGAVFQHVEGLKLKLEGERARRPGDVAPRNAVLVELGTRF